MTTQLALSVEVRPEEVAREKTLGGAIELCAKLQGFQLDKELSSVLKVDKAQFSRWLSGTEGIHWPKLTSLMDACGKPRTASTGKMTKAGFICGMCHSPRRVS